MPPRPEPSPTEHLIPSGGAESSRRLALRRLGVLTGLAAIGGPSALLGGCGGSDTPPPPRLGAHNLVYNALGTPRDPISTLQMTTQASGSTILACVGRGDKTQLSNLPIDNKSNTYGEQDSVHSPHIYTLWTSSGTALYACASAMGGAGHIVFAANSPTTTDEITLAVVEVINGGVIQDVKWNEVLAPAPLTSQTVTTTGPATLVAFWWGDDGVGPVTAVPDSGFTTIDSQLVSQNAVECVVATKDVSAAGSYNVTWTATPAQGAQMWLVAVQ